MGCGKISPCYFTSPFCYIESNDSQIASGRYLFVFIPKARMLTIVNTHSVFKSFDGFVSFSIIILIVLLSIKNIR